MSNIRSSPEEIKAAFSSVPVDSRDVFSTEASSANVVAGTAVDVTMIPERVLLVRKYEIKDERSHGIF